MIQQETQSVGRIDIKAYDTTDRPDDWNTYSDSEKMDYLRSVEPNAAVSEFNTTVLGMHEFFAISLDDTQSIDASVTHLALGDNDTSPAVNNASLNNEVFRKSVTSYTQDENELVASTLITESEANNNTLREVGLFAGAGSDDRMWNHSVIADIVKDDTRELTIDVTLTFTAG